MAYSGIIGNTTFNALKVIDHAFRRCRLPAQAITAEMQDYAIDTLNTSLAELASVKTPSWCIEQLILPMYENQPVVELPIGTVDVLNLNYRVLQLLSGATTTTSTTYRVDFTSATVVNTVGIKWSAAAVPVSFQVSTDGSSWTTVGTSSVTASAGEITWTDISGALAYAYFRIVATSGSLNYSAITLGNLPQQIPLGQLNRDSYVNQSNLQFPGRPSNYYFQRDLPQPIVRLWPAPFSAAEQAQLILWRPASCRRPRPRVAAGGGEAPRPLPEHAPCTASLCLPTPRLPTRPAGSSSSLSTPTTAPPWSRSPSPRSTAMLQSRARTATESSRCAASIARMTCSGGWPVLARGS